VRSPWRPRRDELAPRAITIAGPSFAGSPFADVAAEGAAVAHQRVGDQRHRVGEDAVARIDDLGLGEDALARAGADAQQCRRLP
jgi:hypothetical protein